MKYTAATSIDPAAKLGEGRLVGFLDPKTRSMGLFDNLVDDSSSQVASDLMRNAAVRCLHRNRGILFRYARTQSYNHRIRACLIVELAMRHALRARRRARKSLHQDGFVDPSMTLFTLCEHHAIMSYNASSGVYRVRAGKLALLTSPAQLANFPSDHPVNLAKSPSEAARIISDHETRLESAAKSAGRKVPKRLPFDMFITDVQIGDTFILASSGLMEYLGFGNQFERFSVGEDAGRCMDELIASARKSGATGIISGVMMRTTAYEHAVTEHLIGKARKLQQISVFKNLLPPEILRALEFMKMSDFSANQPVVLMGQTNERFQIVLSGELDVTKNGKRVAQLQAGDCFGEMALIGRTQRYTDVTGRVPGKLLTMQCDRFRQFCAAEPHIASRFLTNILRPLNNRINRSVDRLAMAMSSIDMIGQGVKYPVANPASQVESEKERMSKKSILKMNPDLEANQSKTLIAGRIEIAGPTDEDPRSSGDTWGPAL